MVDNGSLKNYKEIWRTKNMDPELAYLSNCNSADALETVNGNIEQGDLATTT